MIFVFGSNLAGIHGAGAAKYAFMQKGALWGFGIGRNGNSYALPTKNARLDSMKLDIVEEYIEQFISYAKHHSGIDFQVTRIGCGLAGYLDQEIAPLFVNAPDNCFFDYAWKHWLPNKKFWGSF